jgi:hypothetical protein
MIALLKNAKKTNVKVITICISLMIKDVEHFFRFFSAIRYSSGENSLFSSEPHFLMGLFGSTGSYWDCLQQVPPLKVYRAEEEKVGKRARIKHRG